MSSIAELAFSEHLTAMILSLAVVGAIGIILLAERSAEHLLFAIAALLFNAALLLIFVADLERAILLAGVLAVAIAGLSIVKFDHSVLELTVSDLPLAFAGTVPFFVSQYPRMMLGVLVGGLLVVFAAGAILLHAAGSPISMEVRILLFGLALLGFVAAFAAKGAACWRLTLTQPRWFYSTFMASLIDPASWQQFGRLALSDIAIEPLPLREAVPARSTVARTLSSSSMSRFSTRVFLACPLSQSFRHSYPRPTVNTGA